MALNYIRIIPFLIAIIVAMGIFRASYTMDFNITGIAKLFTRMGIDTQFITAIFVAYIFFP